MGEKLIKSETVGVFEFNLIERENPTTHKTHPFGVKTVKHTPKGKYQKFKTTEYIVYKTIEEATKRFDEKTISHKNHLERRKEEKATIKAKNQAVNACDYYQLGDIIVNTWGYEQTNVDFYQVVKITDKTIEIKEIGCSVVSGSDGFMSCNVIANKDMFLENGRSYKLRVYDKGNLSNPASYYYMHKWDGEPNYKSWYA